ncbi:patatin-like phospholipase family protein [Spongiivirga citrea]|uniref:Patatin n=1 Tax=Spongiivirga citrea TaxID=1481457 RepID=A0A6M0CG54_9FLAO|nr:patatin-like phospholipase family protein [Spongiivirga citrea]NER16848.1 patatin [Spongiivirga citrea]
MKTGLILSGGGARGVAHVGILKALQEHHISITHIAGTSAGAVVGALFAAGHSWQSILNFFKKASLFHWKRYSSNKPGFIDTEKFYRDLAPYFPTDDFSILETKLFVTATNLITGTLEVFNSGPLIKSILASAAVPGIFTPISMNGNFYIDGGILNNFPTEPLLGRCDSIIGIYVNPLEDISMADLKHSYQVVNRAFQISFGNKCYSKFSDCDMVIAPRALNKYGLFQMKNIDAIFKIGYDSAINALKDYKYETRMKTQL